MDGRRDQRGVVFPSPVMILSIVAVAMAGVAWVATRHHDADRAPGHADRAAVAERPRTRRTTGRSRPRTAARSRRSTARRCIVEVFNNSSVTGLAGRVAAAGRARWAGRSSGRTTGTARSRPRPSTTRRGSRRPAHQLALDLGIHRRDAGGEPDAARPADGDPDRPARHPRTDHRPGRTRRAAGVTG